MPEEAIDILHASYLQNIQKQISDAQAQGQQEGYAQGQQEQAQHDEEEQNAQAQQQAQEEGSSDVWGDVGSALELGAELFL